MSRRAGGPPGGARPLEPIHAGTSGPDAELFVVEGESAALAVARVRDCERQGLVPMQGKPLNARRATRRRVLAQPFFRALAEALGATLGQPPEPRSLRYGRLLILTDPDADGIHCGFLVLLYFHRWMRPLLDAGRVEVVRPPWGEVVVAGEIELAFSEPELAALADRGRGVGEMTVRRYRGLAAVDPAMLHETCVATATRRTARVSAAEVASMIEVVDALEPEGPGPAA